MREARKRLSGDWPACSGATGHESAEERAAQARLLPARFRRAGSRSTTRVCKELINTASARALAVFSNRRKKRVRL